MVRPKPASCVKTDAMKICHLKMLEDWEFVTKVLKDMLGNRRYEIKVCEFRIAKIQACNMVSSQKLLTGKSLQEKHHETVYSFPQTQSNRTTGHSVRKSKKTVK